MAEKAAAETQTIAQVEEIMRMWHHRIERVAVLAARLGLQIDDGVIFTRLQQRSPSGVLVPMGWKLIASNGQRHATTPALANTADPDRALALIEAMINNKARANPFSH